MHIYFLLSGDSSEINDGTQPGADPFSIAAMKVKAEIKSSVEANRGKPGQIVADKLATVPKEVWYMHVFVLNVCLPLDIMITLIFR